MSHSLSFDPAVDKLKRNSVERHSSTIIKVTSRWESPTPEQHDEVDERSNC